MRHAKSQAKVKGLDPASDTKHLWREGNSGYLGCQLVLFNAVRRSLSENRSRPFDFFCCAVYHHHEFVSLDLSLVFDGLVFRDAQADESGRYRREPPHYRCGFQGANQRSKERTTDQYRPDTWDQKNTCPESNPQMPPQKAPMPPQAFMRSPAV